MKKFKMTVEIENPVNTEYFRESKIMDLDCIFTDSHYLSIDNNKGFEMYIDLRYSRSYKKDYKKWLVEWAESYWSGENGSWKCSKIKIVEV